MKKWNNQTIRKIRGLIRGRSFENEGIQITETQKEMFSVPSN